MIFIQKGVDVSHHCPLVGVAVDSIPDAFVVEKGIDF